MARPRKREQDIRTKWPVLNVTAVERAEILSYAAQTGMSVNAYLVSRALQRPVSARSDQRDLVFEIGQISSKLDEILMNIQSKSFRDTGLVIIALMRIEQSIGVGRPAASEGDIEEITGVSEC